MSFIFELQWRPVIGDPSIMGWVTVAAYAAASALAACAAFRPAKNSSGGLHSAKSRLWLGVAVLMACLCINKQLDLQSLLTDIGRVMARRQGWYEQRRDFQKLLVLAILAGSGIFASWFIWRFREFWLNHKLLTAGLLFLLTFIVVRAISFHHFDVFISRTIFGVRMNWLLELTGILLIALAALQERLGSLKQWDRLLERKG